MKRMLTRTFLSLAVASLFLAAMSFASSAAALQEDSPLAKHMDSINDHLRTLRGQIGDASKKVENLAIVQTVREDFKAARELVPELAADLAGPDREAFLKAFKAQIDKVLVTVSDLEKAISTDMGNQAQELLVKLNDIKKEGHSQFKKPE